jgi:tripartite ATP-independent transporter DctP family solute receptor
MGKGRKKVIGLICLIGLMGFGSGITQGAEITLRYAGNLPLEHHVTKGQELYANLIMEKTKGKVKVEVYPAGQLYSDKDMTRALPSGAVDMGTVTNDQWSGLVPSLMSLQLNLFYDDRPHWWRTMDGEAGEILKKELEKVGVKLLYWMDYGAVELATKFPLRKLENIKGKRMRGYGETSVKYLGLLGSIPTFLGGGEMYMALQRGIIDGVYSGTTSFYDRKIYEVTKYVCIGPHNFSPFLVLINLEKWNQLPADVQKAMIEVAPTAQEWGRKECEKKDIECLELLKQKGMEVNVLSPEEKKRWREASKGIIDIFLKRAGNPGEKLLTLAEKAR